MTAKKELIYNALKDYGCSNAKSLSCYIKRTTGQDISPAAISGQLRSFVYQGQVGKSSNTGETVYWVNKE